MKLEDLLNVCNDYQEFAIDDRYFNKKDLTHTEISKSEIKSLSTDYDTIIHLVLY